MHIVFTDKIDRSFVKILEKSGHSCEVFTAPPEDNSYRFLEAAEVLVVRSRRVTGPMLDSASNLGLIVRAGAGTDNIDVQAASEKGIYVCNVPGKNAAAVAELTMGLLLAVDRSIPAATADLREGRWDKAEYSRANGLKGRSMAIVGLGEIGFEVAQRATAFGIQVRALDRTERSADAVKRIA
ncbi:MAG: NAD(P)-dependent oxidoreductase, partial [Actinomycetota bacterium]|nr:NAD(P)-dependent oxidoreductase [Actinomycetota bacterium]